MKVVFCTVCRGRTEHLARTLPQNIVDNADYPDCAFVVLDYADPGPLRGYLRRNHMADMQSGRLAVYHYCGDQPFARFHNYPAERPDIPFQMSHAKNLAPRCAMLEGADIIVTLDADNFTGPGFARFIADNFREPGIFLCPDFPLIHSLPHGPSRPQRGYAGRLAIRPHDFIKAGGYDETFSTWRGEDIDMIARLRRMGYTERHIDNRFLGVIPHGAEVRFKEYPEAQKYETKGEFAAIESRTETVVNFGKSGVGTVYRNFSFAPVALKSLPTRIFGIGMHRTATTSLHKAFQILGFDSLHWGTGEAPRIWREMHRSGRSATLEQWYALSDLPIPLLYRKLDAAYPGSKFVLTVRDEQKWLASVERLWQPEHNPNRWMWDAYPFSHRIHTVLYGQRAFDAAVFLDRYRRHNAEVMEYFKNRPGDLLVMDMEAGAGWPELCGFLDVTVPSARYPVENRTRIGEDVNYAGL